MESLSDDTEHLNPQELQTLCRNLMIKNYEKMTMWQQENAIRRVLSDKVSNLGIDTLSPLQRKACTLYKVEVFSPRMPSPPPPTPHSDLPNSPIKQKEERRPLSQRLLNALQKCGIKDDGRSSENQLWGRVNKVHKARKAQALSPFSTPSTHHVSKQTSYMSTKIISFINLKGGVAKTTTTVGTAECLAARGYKVLVIDLDPQANATIMLLGEERWRQLDDNGYTLAALFEDAFKRETTFNLEKTIQRNFSEVLEVTKNLELLPASPKMIKQQIALATRAGEATTRYPWKILHTALKGVLKNYQYVLIDCPPSLDYVTRNGLFLSTGYVIPTIPDYLSTYGIPQIIDEILDFQNDKCGDREIHTLGILATKVMLNDSVHDTGRRSLKQEVYAPLFKTEFTQTTDLSRAAAKADFPRHRKDRWGKHTKTFDTFVDELIAKLNEKE